MFQDDESLRIARLLERLVLFQKLPIQKLEDDMGVGRGFLARIFSGKIDLKYRHLVHILTAIDVAPEAFFKLAYDIPDDGTASSSSKALGQLRRVDPPASPSLPPEHFEAAVVAVLQKFEVLPPARAKKPRRGKGKPKDSE
jgi:transcriptional regulator with XRE-family HTH domain